MPAALLSRFPAWRDRHEAEIDAAIAEDEALAHAREALSGPPSAPSPERLAWCRASGAVALLHRARDANATAGARCCNDAARAFEAAAALAAEPQRTQLAVLADAAAALADPFGADNGEIGAVIEAAAETVLALDGAMRAAEASRRIPA